tara:strand:+ start:697 stop:954 length:258 start_codon:yes stop_codon:yes gene_type:complete
MNIVIALLAALIITGGVAPQTKPVVDPIIVGLTVGAIAAPLAVSAGVTGGASILGTTYTNANVVAAGVGAVASAAQVESQIEPAE